MPLSRPAAVLRQLTTSSGTPATDVDLLRAFHISRSESAFTELVNRHGPMVLAVCRRVVGHVQDAEDAFQAVFLVLAQKATTVRGKNIAGWLYGVAVRIARGVRLMRNRRQKREHAVAANEGKIQSEQIQDADSRSLLDGADLISILDEELARLPEHYRLPVVLCELEGRSRKDAATELAIPEGTLSSRLATARKRLAERLSLRGVEVTAGLLAAVFGQAVSARLPEGLAQSTSLVAVAVATGNSTAGLVSPHVSLAVRQGMKATLAMKLRTMVVIAATVGIGLAGWSLGTSQGSTAATTQADATAPIEPKTAQPAKPADPPKQGAKFWPHFVKVVGDDKASRELFELILRSQKSVALLESIAEADNPDPPLAHWYFARRDELRRASLKPSDMVPGALQHVPVPNEDIAGWLLLGTYPGTKAAPKNDDSLFYLYLTNNESDQFTNAMSEECSFSRPLRKLFGAWLANRGDDLHAYYDGFSYALRFDIPESLASARRVLKYYSETPKERRVNFSVAYVRIMCLLVIGERGTKDDLPMVEACFDDRAVGIYTRGGDLLKEKPDAIQVRDVAASVAIHLCDGKPREFGLPERTRNRFSDRFGYWDIVGFATDAEREPVHKATQDWLDKYKGPPHGPVRTFTASAEVGALAFDPKSGNLFVGSQDFAIQTWDPATGKPISVFRAGAEGSVAVGVFSALTVSPDANRVAVRYYIADKTGKFLFGLEGHAAEITRIQYDREGKRILTASWDGTLRIWEAETGKSIKTIEAHMGRKVIPGPQTGVGPKPAGNQPERFEGRGVRDASFSPDGKRIVSGGVDGAIRVWDTETGKEIWGGKVSQALMAVAFLPNGTQVVSGEQEGAIRIWNADNGKEVKKLTGHTSAVTCLAVTPNGKRLVSAACDNTVRVWDLEAMSELRCFRGNTKWVYAVAISPDGKTIASGGEDRVVRIWEMP